MKKTTPTRSSRGFALLLTLALLALLVLVVLALSALTKVDTQLATTAAYQIQARQNAILGLNAALGQLQQYARFDAALTGTADLLASTKASNTRWTAVWPNGASSPPQWLVSGDKTPDTFAVVPLFSGSAAARRAAISDLGSVILVNGGSSNFANGKYLDGDAVIVPKVSIPSATTLIAGNYAYWAGDEGVKVSVAYKTGDIPPASAAQVFGVFNAAFPVSDGGWTVDDSKSSNALTYEQLISSITRAAHPTGSELRSAFHGLTLANFGYTFDVSAKRRCLINVNSAGRRLWSGIWGIYNPSEAKDVGKTLSDKLVAHGPFQNPTDCLFFVEQTINGLSSVQRPSFNAANFNFALQDWLTVRSDTFRIRAYGDSVNPLDAFKVESSAYCEAMVQRVKDSTTPAGEGRFVITYFRWLGPDDI